MLFRAICLTIFSMAVTMPSARALQICGAAQQGGFVRVHDDNLQKISLQGRVYQADAGGDLIMAFERDADLLQPLKVFYKDGSMETKKLMLRETEWDVQKINGLAPSKVTPSESDMAEITKEQKAVREGLAVSVNENGWKDSMLKPLEGKISGKFGNQRIMNGVKKNPHQGMDIAAPEGAEVRAMADGVATLSGGPFFYSGNVVIIGHGHELSTIYAHLQKILVKQGEKISKGQVIGLVGQTGRATGPHLHLGASLNNVRFDAQHLMDFDEAQCVNL